MLLVLAIVAEDGAPCEEPVAEMVIEGVEIDTVVKGVLTLLLVTLVAEEREDSGEESEEGDEEESELPFPLDTFGESELPSAGAAPPVEPLLAIEALLAADSFGAEGWCW